MDDSTSPAGRDKVRDGINRENHAIRRSLRARAEDGKQLERRLDEFTGTQRRTRAAIDAAWRAEHPLGGRQDRVSWRTLGPGAAVVAADGVRVGAVQEVVADEELDVFDGVVVDLRLGPGGLRYVESGAIAMIFDHRLVLRVPSARVQELPARPRRRRWRHAA